MNEFIHGVESASREIESEIRRLVADSASILAPIPDSIAESRKTMAWMSDACARLSTEDAASSAMLETSRRISSPRNPYPSARDARNEADALRDAVRKSRQNDAAWLRCAELLVVRARVVEALTSFATDKDAVLRDATLALDGTALADLPTMRPDPASVTSVSTAVRPSVPASTSAPSPLVVAAVESDVAGASLGAPTLTRSPDGPHGHRDAFDAAPFASATLSHSPGVQSDPIRAEFLSVQSGEPERHARPIGGRMTSDGAGQTSSGDLRRVRAAFLRVLANRLTQVSDRAQQKPSRAAGSPRDAERFGRAQPPSTARSKARKVEAPKASGWRRTVVWMLVISGALALLGVSAFIFVSIGLLAILFLSGIGMPRTTLWSGPSRLTIGRKSPLDASGWVALETTCSVGEKGFSVSTMRPGNTYVERLTCDPRRGVVAWTANGDGGASVLFAIDSKSPKPNGPWRRLSRLAMVGEPGQASRLQTSDKVAVCILALPKEARASVEKMMANAAIPPVNAFDGMFA